MMKVPGAELPLQDSISHKCNLTLGRNKGKGNRNLARLGAGEFVIELSSGF